MDLNIILDELDRIIEYTRFYQKKGYNWAPEDEIILEKLKNKRNKIME